MKRKNFYILLDLSIEPPEEDLKKISAALKKKKTEWSRLLNHPKKGFQAKHFIRLIPEIQKVMTDPDLRKKEAMAAKKLMERENRYKFLTIDRQLSIFLSKGTVTSREIQKLVRLHSVETDDILKWMLKKEKEAASRTPKQEPSYKKGDQLKRIISNLGVRIRKRSDTDEETAGLAKQNKFDKNEILKRTKYPVRSKSDGSPERPKTIDPSVIKAIDINLKVVGKASLYEFLNLSDGSDVKTLKKSSEKKRTEIQKLKKKDAEAAAGGELAGYCLTIFSSESTRTAYDVARARNFLASLNSDIEIAQTDGVIRMEYFEAIASNAVKFGMDYEGACEYIESYCRKKQWKTKSKKKRNRLLIITSALISAVLAVSIGSAVVISTLKNRGLSKEYESVISKVKIQKKLEKKKQLLTQYVKSHDRSDFTEKAEKEIRNLTRNIALRNSIDEKDYKSALAKAAGENAGKNYEKSRAAYEAYLKKHPHGIHADEISKKRSEIPVLIDNRDFQAIKAFSKKDIKKILEASKSYLENHPEGSHRSEIKTLIADMEKPYYDFLKKKIALNEKKKNWEECIQLCDQYFKHFQKGAYLNELKGAQYFFKKQLKNRIELEKLVGEAEKNGIFTESAIKIYSDYLKANPNSPIKYDIKKRLKKITK